MIKICKVYYPEKFNSKVIFRHPEFDDEMRNLLEKSGIKQQFAESFRAKLYLIQKDMFKSTNTRWFEKLKEVPGLYSIKLKMVKNIRVLCMFTETSQRKKIVILLCVFEEKNSKKGSKDSYNKGIEMAKKRKKEIENGFELERE